MRLDQDILMVCLVDEEIKREETRNISSLLQSNVIYRNQIGSLQGKAGDRWNDKGRSGIGRGGGGLESQKIC